MGRLKVSWVLNPELVNTEGWTQKPELNYEVFNLTATNDTLGVDVREGRGKGVYGYKKEHSNNWI